MNLFVFDIETVPDVDAGKKLLNITSNELSDADIAQAMFNQRRQENGTEFLQHYLHKVVAISAVLKTTNKLTVWSLGDEHSNEKELITRFFEGLNRFQPKLISWNGSGFDLPVLHYRSLMHKISAPLYWETGEGNSAFKWNNYISRYHERHTDIMDLLALYQPRSSAPLDKLATLLGFPGKMGMNGAKVWDNYKAGNIKAIRDYCETDVLNTYLVYLRFDLFRGNISSMEYDNQCLEVKEMLNNQEQPHLTEFLRQWENNETTK